MTGRPVPLSDSSPQACPSLPPHVDVEGQHESVLREDPGLPDLVVVLGDDEGDGDSHTHQGDQQPDERSEGRLLQWTRLCTQYQSNISDF